MGTEARPVVTGVDSTQFNSKTVNEVVDSRVEMLSGTGEWPSLPKLATGQRLDLARIRYPLERLYGWIVWLPTVLVGLLIVTNLTNLGFQELSIPVGLFLFVWFSWKFFMASVLGNTIKVGPSQHPVIYRLVSEASECLGIPAPTVFIMQGHGLYETLVAKLFSRRGVIILTSNLVDDLSERGSSRELMFFIGRQLGLMATGFFRGWLFTNYLGLLVFPVRQAWLRRCHFTADRLGLLVSGDLYSAEQALLTLTAGAAIAPSTNLVALNEQRAEVFDSVWARIYLFFSSYPYTVDRIVKLREFAFEAKREGVQAKAPVAIGTLPIAHRRIKALRLIIVHGHDKQARLELENFFFRRFPNISALTMIVETAGASTLPEKFDELAGSADGAVALLTPDDLAIALRDGSPAARARQNVILEVGWFWGHMGRRRCLLLTRGDVEMPSDLGGVETHRFYESPVECAEPLRDFIATLEAR